MMKKRCLFIPLTVAIFLTACSEKEKILKGERIDIRVPLSDTVDRISDPESEDVVYANLLEHENIGAPIQLSATQDHASWRHLNGDVSHRIQHPSLGDELRRQWNVKFGNGNTKTQRLTATPVFSNGQIFIMDSQSLVSAYTETGQMIWSKSLVPTNENASDTSGGGLAYSNGVLFVTTGFGQLHAMNSTNGDTIWTQDFNSPTIFAPTVKDNLVVVVTQDGHAWGVNIRNGRFVRHWESVPGNASIATGSTPAIQGNLAIIPFTSGEIQAVELDSGIVVWSNVIGGSRDTSARSFHRSITSAPVIDNQTVYVGNQAGKMMAIEIASGKSKWIASESSYNPVWPEDNAIFLVSDVGELLRLNAQTGDKIWGVELPYFKRASIQGRLFNRGRKSVYANYGPILAGGRLIVASSDGIVRFFNPVDGQMVNTIDLGVGAATAPIVINQTLYLVDSSGRLLAYQ